MMKRLASIVLATLLAFSAAAQVTTNPAVSGVGITQTIGTWTPTDNSGAALTFTGVSAAYTRLGNIVHAYGQLTYPSTADGSAAGIAGFPIKNASPNYARVPCTIIANTTAFGLLMNLNATTSGFLTSAQSNVTNAQLSTATLYFMCTYPAS